MTEIKSIGSAERPLRVAIVGAGPSGFFAAGALLDQSDVIVELDLFERLPTPYGLVRGGVAPDHQKIKNVSKRFEKVGIHPKARFYGNVELGMDIFIADLESYYDQIVYAVGNEDGRRLGIEGEALNGVLASPVFVGWYNGHPDFKENALDFTGKKAIIVGAGNVAIDVARILAKRSLDLVSTDVPLYALELLEKSNLDEITFIIRRGPVQSAFSASSFKELAGLKGANLILNSKDLELDPISQEEFYQASSKEDPRKNMAVLEKFADLPCDESKPRDIRFRFFTSPVEILGNENGHISQIRVEKNELVRDGERVRVQGTGEIETLDADLMVFCIGSYGKPILGLPFNKKKGIINNQDGRVVEEDLGDIRPNQYAVGWAMSGPRGLIGTQKVISFKVAKLMLEDLSSGSVIERDLAPRDEMKELLENRSVDYVSFEDWQIIDEAEVVRGKSRGAPREKFTDVSEILAMLEAQKSLDN